MTILTVSLQPEPTIGPMKAATSGLLPIGVAAGLNPIPRRYRLTSALAHGMCSAGFTIPVPWLWLVAGRRATDARGRGVAFDKVHRRLESVV